MRTETALLPKLWPQDAIQLGRLVSIPLEPKIRYFEPPAGLLMEQDIVEADPEEPYAWYGLRYKEAHGKLSIARLLKASANTGKTEYLQITAEQGQYKALKDSDSVFRKLCRDSQAARIWMQDLAVYERPFYLVIGLQAISKASFRVNTGKGGAFEVGGSIPLEPSQVQQLCADAGASDLAVEAGRLTTSGILGIEVRRVDCKIRTKEQKTMQRQQQKEQQKSALPVVLTDSIAWAYSYQQTKGGPAQGDTEEVVATLSGGPVDDDELEALYQEFLDNDSDSD